MKRVVSWVLRGQFQRALGFFLKSGYLVAKVSPELLLWLLLDFFLKTRIGKT
jgi:hypothetical protein